jgi:Domain of unknown function (DUF5655)
MPQPTRSIASGERSRTETVPSILKSPASRTVYARLLEGVASLGPFDIEVKKTCVHLSHGRAFAGVHPRAAGIMLQLVSEKPIRSPRVMKLEQVSANRFHCAFKLEDPREIDTELMGWVKQSRELKRG